MVRWARGAPFSSIPPSRCLEHPMSGQHPSSPSHYGREEPPRPTAAEAVVVGVVGSSISHHSPVEQPALSSGRAFMSGGRAGVPAIRCNNTGGSLSPHRENGKRARAAFGCQE